MHGDKSRRSFKLLIFISVIQYMKLIRIIMAIIVLVYTTQPLLSEAVHERLVHNQGMELSCCEGEAVECSCCGDQEPQKAEAAGDTRTTGDEQCARDGDNDMNCDADRHCSGHCHCALHSVVVNALACFTPELIVFGEEVEELVPISESFQNNTYGSVWHPPKA